MEGDDTLLARLLAQAGSWRAPDVAAWRAFVEHVAEMLDVGPGTSVLDVGCRSGAFLFPLWENGYRVGGVDPSEPLLALARAAMPGGRFTAGAPRELDPAEAWDVVIASRDLAGLRNEDDVRAVIARMAAKATHAVALLDLPEDLEAGGGAPGRQRLLRLLAQCGVSAVQFEAEPDGRFHVFARV